MSSTLDKSVRLLALMGGVALTLSGECQPLFLGVFFSFFLSGFKIGDFPGLLRFFGAAQPFLAAFFMALAVVDFIYLSNSFLLTVAHFLLAIQGVRLLALRTNRENIGSVLLSSLTMLSASTLSVDWTFLPMLFVFLLAVIWTLMLLTILEENREASSEGIREKSLLWRELMPVLRGATGIAFFVAFFCCAAVFIFFPRFNFQGFRGQFLQPVHKTGFTSQVDLGNTGKIYEDNSVVMRVEIDPADRSLWTGYLRGRALEMFNGRLWDKYPSRGKQVFHQGRGRFTLRPSSSSKRVLRQKIYLESMDSPLLFAQSQPVFVDIERPILEMGDDGSFQRRYGDAWRVHYEVESSASLLDPTMVPLPYRGGARGGATRGAVATPQETPPLSPPLAGRGTGYLRGQGDFGKNTGDELLFVPQDLLPIVKTLSDKEAGRAGGALEKSLAIQRHLRARYAYSLGGPAAIDDKRNPLAVFLAESKKGHCEYFAAAMVLMLRAQGIPARMATGFLSQEWNSRGNYYIVRMKHAHAWAEAYIEPYGWVGFDPSPPDTSTGSRPAAMGRWAEIMDTINLRWNRYILSYDFERQVEIVTSVSQKSSAVSIRLGRWADFSEKWAGWTAALRALSTASTPGERAAAGRFSAAAAIGGIGLILFLGAAALRRWRRRADRVWFYRIFLRRLEKRLGKKSASQTLREYLAESGGKLGPLTEPAHFLNDAYYRLRFDPNAPLSAYDNATIQQKLSHL